MKCGKIKKFAKDDKKKIKDKNEQRGKESLFFTSNKTFKEFYLKRGYSVEKKNCRHHDLKKKKEKTKNFPPYKVRKFQ